jgi:two-component system sensor histidine kinase ChvG
MGVLALVPPPPHVHEGPVVELDLATRPEVKKALGGEYAAATRVWAGGNRVFLFSAVPIGRAGHVEGVVYVTRSTNPVRVAMRRLRATLYKVLAAALAATTVLSLLFAATISRPLSRLTRIAERIAAGDRTERLSLDRKDEIGQLARAFDAMERKLDERARYVAELAANISHEFKSPLTSVRGAAELLLDGAADDPAARQRFLENILSDARRLDRLVTRLLELSRVEADPVPTEAVDWRELVDEAAEAARQPGRPEVLLQYSEKLSTVVGRRAHLLSALGNLLDNAAHFAAPGTAVTLEVSDGDGRIVTKIHNHGSPISEANLARIWDRFFTTRAADGGTGLGLPIVRTVVAAHGGTVSVTSTAGDGTRFSFDLPAAVC